MLNILIGFASGIISGMGIGGGAILIPALIFISQTAQKTAQGINLLYFLPTAVFALIIHFKNKNVQIKDALIIGISGIIGALAGTFVAMTIDGDILRRLFGIFLAFIGIRELLKGIKG